MSRIHPAFNAFALILGLVFTCAALAAEPASQEVAVPTQPGESVVVEWTGTALPGAMGAGNMCPPGVDSAEIVLSVPEGAYDSVSVTADFHIEWDEGTAAPGELFTDPDLVLTIYEDGLPGDSSDGGSPQENVGLANPAAGTYAAVTCPFAASQPTPYRGRLTLTALEPQACVQKSGVIAHAEASAVSGVAAFVEAAGLPNADVFHIETKHADKPLPANLGGRLQSTLVDRTLGVPTFLWARRNAPVAAVGALTERELLVAHAREHLRSEAKALRLDAALIEDARVADAQFNGNGPAVVRFRQRVDGVEVFHRSLNVLLDRSYRPVAVSGYFATDFDRAAPRAFTLSGAQAIANAWTHLGGALSAAALVPSRQQGEWQWYGRPLVTGTHWFEREPRARAVYYPRANGLEPAYHVELFAKARANGNLMAYGLVVSAVDGKVLHRADLKAHAEEEATPFTYRTFADAETLQPFDSPVGNEYAPFPGQTSRDRPERVGVPTQLVTLPHAGIVTGDAWLPADATQTTGNHVDACIDAIDQGVNTPAGGLAVPPPVNSCLEDVEPRAATTGANSFDYAIVADSDPSTDDAKNGAVVNMFYMINWLHDWWYNHGFDEVSGNAQESNYGRGGEEGDRLLAQGQDASGRNNANMATPSDGSSPVMQQYLFDGRLLGEVRQLAPVAGEALVWETIANGSATDYDITGELALVNDGLGVSPTDACGPAYPYPEEVNEQGLPLPLAPVALPPDPALEGKIAVVDRGNCNTTYKLQYAIASGAIGLIVVNNVDGDPPSNIGNLDVPLSPVQPTEKVYETRPVVIIRKDDGEALKAQIAAGETVTMKMTRQPSIDADGTLDNQIIAHEYFHYVHHRLTDSSNQQARAMSEGWGDINAFMMTVRPEDRFIPGNDKWQGAYAAAAYVTNNFWSGIRRVPYTTDFEKNAFTFQHISNGVPTPDGGAGATNSQVHASGEIWANMMFECYAGLLRNSSDRAFGEAQSRMQDYIIGGFKMTPADATYTEARDAVLAVVYATDFDDYRACSAGFARRGNGLNAVAPARASTDHAGVQEDYTPFVCGKANLPPGGDSDSPVVGGLGLLFLMPLFGAFALRRRR